MSDMTSSIPKQSLEKLKTEISTWRSQKTSPQQKVPEEIWAKVAKIAPFFSLKTLVETLKLDAKLIRKRNLAVGSQLSTATKTETPSPTNQPKKTTSTQKTLSGATTTAKESSKTANGNPSVKGKDGTFDKQQQSTTSAKKKPTASKAGKIKTSNNMKNTKPQNSSNSPVKPVAKTNEPVNKPAVAEFTKTSVKQDNLHPVEIKMPNGTIMTVKLPLQELLHFVKRAAEQ
jgi:hypothetical protein